MLNARRAFMQKETRFNIRKMLLPSAFLTAAKTMARHENVDRHVDNHVVVGQAEEKSGINVEFEADFDNVVDGCHDVEGSFGYMAKPLQTNVNNINHQHNEVRDNQCPVLPDELHTRTLDVEYPQPENVEDQNWKVVKQEEEHPQGVDWYL
ncbi:hypothetical protein HK102_008210 [Quaeritorhiza haematococci]|nr:hypothetical protein HK102_008210 [Quaeritorhiza haematococci]